MRSLIELTGMQPENTINNSSVLEIDIEEELQDKLVRCILIEILSEDAYEPVWDAGELTQELLEEILCLRP